MLFLEDENIFQKSASMVEPEIKVELQSWSPIFEKCSHLREKEGVLMLLKTTLHLVAKTQYRLYSRKDWLDAEISAPSFDKIRIITPIKPYEWGLARMIARLLRRIFKHRLHTVHRILSGCGAERTVLLFLCSSVRFGADQFTNEHSWRTFANSDRNLLVTNLWDFEVLKLA
jgi:hypothetical protein